MGYVKTELQPKDTLPASLINAMQDAIVEHGEKFDLGFSGFNIQGAINSLTADEDTREFWAEKAEGVWYVQNYNAKRCSDDRNFTSHGFIINIKLIGDGETLPSYYQQQIFMGKFGSYKTILHRNMSNSNTEWCLIDNDYTKATVTGYYKGSGSLSKKIGVGHIQPKFLIIQGYHGKMLFGFIKSEYSYVYDITSNVASSISTTWENGYITIEADESAQIYPFNYSETVYYYFVA